MIWGHPFDEWNTNRSGFAQVCGNDFIVTAWAGGFTGSLAEQAGTLIHELGHNLCLHHGGLDDSPNYEPIYASSMNYRYQGSGLNEKSPGVLTGLPDYSTIQFANLNEAAGMAETNSFASATAEPISTLAYKVRWDCPAASGFLQMSADPNPDDKDWNCNGGIAASPMVDINGDGTLNTNTGFDDWNFLANSTTVPLRFHENVANYADGAGQVTSAGSEMTDTEAEARGFLLVVVDPTAALLPGCSDQSSSSGRRIPLVVYGTTTFDASAIQTGWSANWNGAAPIAGFVDDVDSDGEDDWIGHFPADDVVLGAGTSAFTAQLATSQVILAQPAVSFAAVADTDGDGLDDNCDACPATLGTDAYGCP